MRKKNRKEETMLKKTLGLTTLFILLFALSSLLAYPTFYGTEGIYRTYAAKTTEMGYLTFGLHGDYSYADIANSDNARHYININTFLGYAPINYFELALNARIQARYYSRASEEDVYNFAFKGLRPIVKLGLPVFRDTVNQVGFTLGAAGFLNIPWQPVANSDSEMVYNGFIGTAPRKPNFGGLFLVDFDFNVMSIHLNLGSEGPADFKDPDNIPSYINNTFAPLEPERRNLWGIGFEILTGPYVKFLFEAKGKLCKNAVDTMWVTPGIRFITPVGVTIDLGADFSTLSDMDFVPDYDSTNHAYISQRSKWRAFFGITSSSAIFAKPPAPPKAIIAGKITDEASGEPLAATISFPGSDLGSIVSDPETGLYKLVVSPGIYRFHVSTEGYKWVEKPIRVVKGETEVADFALQKKPKPPEKEQGILTGKVVAVKDNKPLLANVTIVELDKKVTTDVATGVYKIMINPGTYTVKAEADKYVTDAKPGVVVKEKETTIQSFQLNEKIVKGQVITLRGIYFDTGKATIRSESYPVLDDALRVLTANPKVIVEIAGHTDSVGSNAYNMRLSEARANSVRTYLLSRGISPNRLIARGYGESMPVASNTTREGRQMNRRIEFRVLKD